MSQSLLTLTNTATGTQISPSSLFKTAKKLEIYYNTYLSMGMAET